MAVRFAVLFIVALLVVSAGCVKRPEAKQEDISPEYADGKSDFTCFEDFEVVPGHKVKVLQKGFATIGPFYDLDKCDLLKKGPINASNPPVEEGTVWSEAWNNRFYCYKQRAEWRGEPAYCEKIPERYQKAREDCFLDTAANMDRPDLCEMVRGENRKERCLRISQDEMAYWTVGHCLI